MDEQPLPLTVNATVPLIAPPVDPYGPESSFARLYGRHPGKAAQRATWLRQKSTDARARGDMLEADHFDDQAARYEAVLGHLGRCRCCGRELKHPDSVKAGIGPECARTNG
jgi:hypothetical protein